MLIPLGLYDASECSKHQIKAEIQSYKMVPMILYQAHDGVRNLNNNSKNAIFEYYFLKVVFSITKAYTYFKFLLLSLHSHLEGTVSQIFNLGPSFYFMAKIGKHYLHFEIIIF